MRDCQQRTQIRKLRVLLFFSRLLGIISNLCMVVLYELIFSRISYMPSF